MRKMVCDKVVCDRWCVTQLGGERWVCDKVCVDKGGCDRWCVTKLGGERWCVTKLCE